MVIGIKEHGTAFLDVLQQAPKWIGFWNAAINLDETFTLILDGWDELIEEQNSRRDLIRLLSSLDREHFCQFRLRIAARPEIPEQRILDDLRMGCPWFVENAARKDSPRLVLTPLCKDHVEALWTAFGSGNRYQDLKVSEIEDRKKDIQCYASLPSKGKLLEYLGENHPSIAIQSVDILTSPHTRDRLVRLWWQHPKTNRNDYEQIRTACEILPNESIPWLEEELQKLSPLQDARCLAYFLGHLNERPVSSVFLNTMQETLQLPDLHEDLISEILDILSEKNYGDHSFWQQASQKWLPTERAQRIPAIAQQLRMHGEPTANILALFVPVYPLRQSFRYTEYLNIYFNKLQKSDLPDALQWACSIPAKSFISGYRHTWAGSAYEGLLDALIREKDVQGLLTLAAHLWNEKDAFFKMFPDDKKVEDVLSKDLLEQLQDALLASETTLLLFKERGFLDNEWIFAESGKIKIMQALQQEVHNHGYSRKADLLIDIARLLGVSWSDHIDLLYDCKNKAEEFSDVKSNQLKAIFSPVVLKSKK